MVKIEFAEIAKKQGYSFREIRLFERTIDYAREALENRTRLSGESEFTHNINIGVHLIKSKLMPEVIVAGLLYNVEKVKTQEEIQKEFGSEIANLVMEQLKLKQIEMQHKEKNAEMLRQILVMTTSDIRVIFVKFADKLDNLRTVHVFGKKELKRICNEVLEIYSPLAGRFGLEYFKKTLEDVAFKNLFPKKYKEISEFIKENQEQRAEFILNFIEEIKDKLRKIRIIKIKGREKQIYSIYKKIVERKVPLKEQKDHFAIRVIVKSKDDCYKALGVIHENYTAIPEKISDYILNPKPNGYQSLHTTIKLENGKFVEIQIRTQEMDEVAEEGVASHWSYKKMKSDPLFEKKIGWLKSVLESSKDNSLIGTIKKGFFDERIYCYTPKGKAIYLPAGSTILDFAYQIHQDIGNKAIAGRINGNFASLKAKLSHGDVVEIVTNKNQRPRREWIKFVVSKRARDGIKKEIKKLDNISISSSMGVKPKKEDEYEGLVFSPDFPNHTCLIAKCCSPLPGDKIFGVIKSFKKIAVHKQDCKSKDSLTNRIENIQWKETFNKPIKIFVLASDRSGILAEILNAISRRGFVVKDAKAKIAGNATSECSLIIIPKEMEEIKILIQAVKRIRGVKKIWIE